MRLTARRLLLILIGVPAVLGATAMAVLAANVKPDFSIAGAPTSQTVLAGQETSYTITVARSGGYAEPVAPSVSGLPSNAAATFSVAPITGASSTMTVTTSTSTPAGTYALTITGTGKTLTRSTTVQLVVQPQAKPKFTVAASPTTQTVLSKDSADFSISIARSGGFSGSVSVTANGLPSGAAASFSPATVPASASDGATGLTISTTAQTPAGAYTINVVGTARIDGATVTVSTPVTLQVQTGSSFAIAGDLAGALAPGVTRPIALRLSNPNNFSVTVTSLTATVAQTTSKSGCDGSANFSVTQVPQSAYPFTLAGKASDVALSSLIGTAALPRVTMRNLPTNQDVCKGVRLTLSYSGTATK